MKCICRAFVPVVSIALLAACATGGQKAARLAAAPAATEVKITAPGPDAVASGMPGQTSTQGNRMQASTDPLARRAIYFAFDKADVKAEDRQIVKAHAAYLVSHPRVHVRLEGFADERGTREYNMALGERRGNSVLALFSLQGVAPEQIETISYGEERPIARGHDESSWRLNRRVEIVYL